MQQATEFKKRFDKKIITPTERLLALALIYNIYEIKPLTLDTSNLVILSKESDYNNRKKMTINAISTLKSLEIFTIEFISKTACNIHPKLDFETYQNFLKTFEKELPELLSKFSELKQKLTADDNLESLLKILLTQESPTPKQTKPFDANHYVTELDFSQQASTKQQQTIASSSTKPATPGYRLNRHRQTISEALTAMPMGRDELVKFMMQKLNNPDKPNRHLRTSCINEITRCLEDHIIFEKNGLYDLIVYLNNPRVQKIAEQESSTSKIVQQLEHEKTKVHSLESEDNALNEPFETNTPPTKKARNNNDNVTLSSNRSIVLSNNNSQPSKSMSIQNLLNPS